MHNYIRYVGDTEAYPGLVYIEPHIATIQFMGKNPEVVVSTAGFDVFEDEDCTVNLGGDQYHGFTTVYRNDEELLGQNCYQLSDDESVYVAPVPPEPSVPTLDDVKSEKVLEMNDFQQLLIVKGIEVTLTDGSKERFSLTSQNQISLGQLKEMALAGMEKIPWHEDDPSVPCRYYSAEDMLKITNEATTFVAFHVTKFRDLRIYINSLTDIDSVNAVTYDVHIPEAYQSEVLKDFYAQGLE